MKILGHTSNAAIVEVSVDELKVLFGSLERHYDESAALRAMAPIGRKVELEKTWKRLAPIVRGAEELNKQAEALRGMASLLDQSAELLKRTTELTAASAAEGAHE